MYPNRQSAAVHGGPWPNANDRSAMQDPNQNPQQHPKPTIYCFIQGEPWPGDVSVVALAESGALLASHVSSSAEWARNDIGAPPEGAELTPIGHSKHRVYGEHYPKGYRVEWVERDAVESHPGVQAAYDANRKLHKAEGATPDTAA